MSRRKTLAQREPNGRPQRGPQPLAAGEVRRLRDASLAGMRDPLWGTEIGRLFLTGKISESCFAAGKRWAENAAMYGEALCAPSPDPRSVNLERQGGTPIDPDTHEGRREARRHRRAVESFTDAWVALKAVGARAEVAVRTVTERDQMLVGHEAVLSLRDGLEALAGFWGLTDSRKSRPIGGVEPAPRS